MAAYNFTLLQWLVVDGIEQCSLKLLFRRTRPTSSDKSATASNAGRYSQCLEKKRSTKRTVGKDTDVHFETDKQTENKI